MPAPYSPADRAAEIQQMEASHQACMLDGHVFWVAPRTLTAIYERVHVEVPTDNGVGRLSYGMKPTQLQMQGWTGNGGLEELRAIKRLMPSFTNKDVQHTFIYAPLDLHMVIYLDYFAPTNDTSFTYYIQFEMRGQEFPPTSAAYTPILTNAGNAAVGAARSIAQTLQGGF